MHTVAALPSYKKATNPPDITVSMKLKGDRFDLIRDTENTADKCTFTVPDRNLARIDSWGLTLSGELTVSYGGRSESVPFTAVLHIVW